MSLYLIFFFYIKLLFLISKLASLKHLFNNKYRFRIWLYSLKTVICHKNSFNMENLGFSFYFIIWFVIRDDIIDLLMICLICYQRWHHRSSDDLFDLLSEMTSSIFYWSVWFVIRDDIIDLLLICLIDVKCLIDQNVTIVTENESKLLMSGRAEQLKEKQQFEIKVLFIFINLKRWGGRR